MATTIMTMIMTTMATTTIMLTIIHMITIMLTITTMRRATSTIMGTGRTRTITLMRTSKLVPLRSAECIM